MQWLEYLSSAQACNKSKPFKDGKYRPDYQFCRDCNQQKAFEAGLEGKCDFKAYQASLLCGAPAPASALEVT